MSKSSNGTRLDREVIDNLEDAYSYLGKHRVDAEGYHLVPLILTPAPSIKPYAAVPEGFFAVLTTNGRWTSLVPAGLQYVGCLSRIEFLVPKQHITFDTPSKTVITADNVEIEIDVTLIFHIMDDPKSIQSFIYNLGPEQLDKQLRAFQDEAIRTMARKTRVDQAYDLMDSKHDQELDLTKQMMNEKLAESGVQIDFITITSITLPNPIAKSMEKSTTFSKHQKKAEIEQKYEILKIENVNAQKKLTQTFELQRQQITEDYKNLEAKEQSELKNVNATWAKRSAEIEEQTRNTVNQLQSEGELSVASINAERDVERAKIIASAQMESKRIESETAAYVRNTKAKAEEQVAKNDASALLVLADAEAFAADAMKEKREFEARMSKLEILRSLALNDQIFISGHNSDNISAQILSALNSKTIGLQAFPDLASASSQ